MAAPVLEINRLTKWFGGIQAVNNVSFSVRKGQVYGILGPNGSGKTTILGMILGAIRPTSGSYQWFGIENPRSEHRQKIGALLETPHFYPYLTGYQNLALSAKIKNVSSSEIEPILKKVGLFSRRHSKYKAYSTGMKQRLGIGASLLGEPQVLVLDEPSNGLDPQGMAEVRNLVRQESEQGRTVLMASHLLDEVEKICTDVAVLREGELLSEGNVKEVLHSGNRFELGAGDMDRLKRQLEQLESVTDVQESGQTLTVTADESIDAQSLNEYLYEKGIVITHLCRQKTRLEDHFLQLMNESE